MNHLLFQLIIMVFIVASTISGYAQNTNGDWVESINVSGFSEHVAKPFRGTDIIRSHWGGTLAYEASKRRTGVYQYAHIFQGGYYYHHEFNQVAFVAWKPKFELRFLNTFNIHTVLGVGYAHSFPTRPSYRLKAGEYVRQTNWGSPHFMPSLGIGTGIHFDRLLDIPGEVFFRYEAFSLAPYKPKGSLPFTLNTMLSVGLKYSIN